MGGSISIGEYAGEPKCGAISLFYRNKDEIYPEFKGKGLRTLYPGIDLYFVASDGGTSSIFVGEQLPALLPGGDERTNVTLTGGRNDFLSSLGQEGLLPPVW
ncbi:MAG: hypothetical protein GTO13_01460 [Proteobacteria bacterium]|nr:hypothetical protein [Pseudomonadota bacterium]